MSLTLPDNVVLSDGLRWIVCDQCNEEGTSRILILSDESPHCSTCDSMSCPDHLYKCYQCESFLCKTCYDKSEYCNQSDNSMCKNCERTCRCGTTICRGCLIYCNWCQHTVCHDCIISCCICDEYTHICDQCAFPCELCKKKTCRCCWDTTCKTCKTSVHGTFCYGCRRSDKIHTICLKLQH